MKMPCFHFLSILFLGIAVTSVCGQLDGFDYGQGGEALEGGLGLSGLSLDLQQYQHQYQQQFPQQQQQDVLQQQYNFPAVSAAGLGGFGNGLIGGSGHIGIPSTESITQLGQAIQEGGVPAGPNGEIATPTQQPPPQGEERRVGIANRLLGAGFLGKRRR